jgi:hypothetical protein
MNKLERKFLIPHPLNTLFINRVRIKHKISGYHTIKRTERC